MVYAVKQRDLARKKRFFSAPEESELPCLPFNSQTTSDLHKINAAITFWDANNVWTCGTEEMRIAISGAPDVRRIMVLQRHASCTDWTSSFASSHSCWPTPRKNKLSLSPVHCIQSVLCSIRYMTVFNYSLLCLIRSDWTSLGTLFH